MPLYAISDERQEKHMPSMNISLSDPMREWVEAQTRSGRYDTASEYMRDLIRHDQDRAMKIKAMQALVTDALKESDSMLSLNEIRQLAQERFKQGER